jgi:hypothetical protein
MAWCLLKHRDNFTFTFSILRNTNTFKSGACHHRYCVGQDYMALVLGSKAALCMDQTQDWRGKIPNESRSRETA